MGQLNKTTEEINRHFTEVEEFMAETPGKKATATGAEVFNDYENNNATGQYSHAEGVHTTASGEGSHAGGYGSVSGGIASFAHGFGINTTLDYETALGMFNAEGPRTRFSVGIGTADDDRKNALEVTTSGNTYLYGVGGYDGTNADTAVPVNQLDRPTRSTVNMNDCLQTGFYPWCTLGRPAGATGAFSLSVRRASTPDGNGFYTVEQTCYGREAELGQVWTRMVFDKGGSTSPDTDYMEWIRVDGSGGGGGKDDGPLIIRLSYCQGNGFIINASRPLRPDERPIFFMRKKANRIATRRDGQEWYYTNCTRDKRYARQAWSDEEGKGGNYNGILEKRVAFRDDTKWIPDYTKTIYVFKRKSTGMRVLPYELLELYISEYNRSDERIDLITGHGSRILEAKADGTKRAFSSLRFAVGILRCKKDTWGDADTPSVIHQSKLVSNLEKFDLTISTLVWDATGAVSSDFSDMSRVVSARII